MHHILLSLIVVAFSLLISIRRNGLVVGYFTLSWTPVALLSIAVLSQKAFGFTRFSEVTYHVGYDTSYLLLMVGILMLLHAVVTHTAKALLILGSCLSAVPILSLTISDRIYG